MSRGLGSKKKGSGGRNEGQPEPFAIGFLEKNRCGQVFRLSDQPGQAAFPHGYSRAVAGLFVQCLPRPRLRRRDRHGIAPCSEMSARMEAQVAQISPGFKAVGVGDRGEEGGTAIAKGAV